MPRFVDADVRRCLQTVEEDIHESAQKGWTGEGGVVDMHITNVVSLCDFGYAEQGLKMPIIDICNAMYSKFSTTVFPATISHCRESQCTHILFSTSTCVCTGAKSSEASLNSVTLYAHALNGFLHHYVKVHDFSVTNLVMACQLGRPIDMERLTAKHQHSGGAPRSDVFPGYRLSKYKLYGSDEWTDTEPWRKIDKEKGDKSVSFIIFSNGKVNVTGGNDEDDLSEIDDELKAAVDEFLL